MMPNLEMLCLPSKELKKKTPINFQLFLILSKLKLIDLVSQVLISILSLATSEN